MKDMLNFMIARDTVHPQQRLAVVEELGPPAPIVDVIGGRHPHIDPRDGVHL